jgi:FtsP/CotA-like multicopper oxidase with cupredoxin domain
MAETDDVNVQNVDTAKAIPTIKKELVWAARRRFLRQALAATSGVALAELLPSVLLKAAPQNAPVCTSPGPAFIPVNEITSQGQKLQAVMKVMSGKRNIPPAQGGTSTSPTSSMLRYFDGYNPNDPSQKWPITDSAGPGPTLRCEIGDVVQITLLNQVDVGKFGKTLDSGEQGRGDNCDHSTSDNGDGTTNKNWYPATDKYPNCLHGSSSANMHFHGTHVTPSTTGDNVLVNVRPKTDVKEADVKAWFEEIFRHCEMGHEPTKWEDLPLGWRDYQKALLQNYDKTAPYEGPGRNPDGHGLPGPPAYPVELRLWPQNAEAIAQNVWPQWYMGSYPYCFHIPRYQGPTAGKKMGQAPGTHWYHSHKHGSTAINLFNGLAGALIITDNRPTGYDGKLKAYYSGKLEEKVLVIQQLTAAPNLLSLPGRMPLLVNGQLTPTITMKRGQIQLWRIINASVQKFLTAGFDPCPGSTAIRFMQTAQDGVQFSPKNYRNQPLTRGKTPLNHMAPANRVDLLVQAPDTPGLHVLQTHDNNPTPIIFINVTADRQPMEFPPESEFPMLPPFLDDIDPSAIRLRRDITYGWNQGVNSPKRDMKTGEAPQFYIDGKQFQDQDINQVMLLDTAEEWTIYNATMTIAHPFHIHVNPFQIVEFYDPSNYYGMGTIVRFDDPPGTGKNLIWWDTFGIPPGIADPNDPETDPLKKKIIPGYFKMRTRFVDFTGQYVQHCHILAHEDRGMMQLLEVVPNKTILKHH